MSLKSTPLFHPVNKTQSPMNFSKRKNYSLHSIHKSLGPPTTYESVSTLQRSIQSISFPRALRINLKQLVCDDSSFAIFESQNLNYKSKRSTSFGYGQKQCMPPFVLKNARDFPGANTYKIPSQFDTLNKGKSFGMSRECFQKNFLPGIDQMPLGVAKEIPGPGQYEIKSKIKNGGFSLTGKGNAFNNNGKDNGPCIICQPKMEFVEPGRFKRIGFGCGKRGDFLKIKNQSPGPGTYDYSSIFQKYDKKF